MTKPNYHSYQTERPVGLTWLLELKLELGDVSSETKLPPSGQAINLPYFPPLQNCTLAQLISIHFLEIALVAFGDYYNSQKVRISNKF